MAQPMPYSAPEIRTTESPPVTRHIPVTSPSYVAFMTLRIGFAVLPIIAGLDKFFDLLVKWEQYLSPAYAGLFGVSEHFTMMAVGIVEILAGLIVAIAPAFGGYLVMVWLWAIIVNLLLIPGYYDIALRDFGLSLGAFALAQLAAYHRGH